MWLIKLFFPHSANLICRTTDISKYFRESLGIRDNESRLYLNRRVFVMIGSSMELCSTPARIYIMFDATPWSIPRCLLSDKLFVNHLRTSPLILVALNLCISPACILFGRSLPRRAGYAIKQTKSHESCLFQNQKCRKSTKFIHSH